MRQRAVQLLDGEEHGRHQEDDLRQELQEGDQGTGGTVSPNYITQQNSSYRHVYTKGRGVTRPTAAQLDIAQRNLAAKRAADARKAAEAERKKTEEKKKQNERESGFKAGLSKLWDNTGGRWCLPQPTPQNLPGTTEVT
ncbi:hypothetical protein NQP46_11810 [Streptomyces albus]|nr:hypothetical protein NQP46_11810 [Streptomyces albus]